MRETTGPRIVVPKVRLEPLCSCEFCLEMRMWREVRPTLKRTSHEEFDNLGEAFRLLGQVLVRELGKSGAALGRLAARLRRV